MALGTDEATQPIFGISLPAGSVNFGDLEIYNKGGYEYKLIRTIWGPGETEGLLIQYNIPSFASGNPPTSVNIWQGTFDSTWENPANWSKNQVPGTTTDVLITCQGRVVVTSTTAVCRSLDIHPGSILTVNPGFKITVMH